MAKLGLALLLCTSGCSLIYNPDHIKVVADAKEFMDAPPPDVEVIADADHSMISLTGAYPATINEGAGDGGSRPAIVELDGMNFEKAASENMMLMVSGYNGITVADFKVATDGDYIVAALHVPVDTTCAAGTMKQLTVSVVKVNGAGTVMATLDPSKLAVKCLDELTTVPAATIDPPPLYSQIAITSPINFTPTSGAARAILRSVSSISIATGGGSPLDIDASASGTTEGPGGGAGGAADAAGGGPGQGGAGTGGGGGGGGGFGTAGTAGAKNTLNGGTGGSAGAASTDIWISSYATSRSGGGGGGASGGAGGGGGGTIELTAGGDLTVGGITANGAAGASSTVIAGGGGGGGSGGVVLLRAGGMLKAGAFTLNGAGHGSGNTTGGVGGDGGLGRARIDAASLANAPEAGAKIGPMFMGGATVTTSYPTLTLTGTANDSSSVVKVYDKTNNLVHDQFGITSFPVGFGATTPVATATVQPPLKIGYKRVCVFVSGNTDPNVAEGTNCIEVGYAP